VLIKSHKPFIELWQHTGKSCIHKIHIVAWSVCLSYPWAAQKQLNRKWASSGGAGTKQTLIGSRNHVLDVVKLPIVNGTSERLLENIVKDFWESSRRLALQNRCTYQRAIFFGGGTDSCGLKKPCFRWITHRRHLANTINQSVQQRRLFTYHYNYCSNCFTKCRPNLSTVSAGVCQWDCQSKPYQWVLGGQ